MAEQQQKPMDSAGLTTGSFIMPSHWSSAFATPQLRVIKEIASLYGRHWVKKEISKTAKIAALEARIIELESEQQAAKLAYEAELQRCLEYCKKLEKLFNETEESRIQTIKSATDARADVRTIQRTIERLNNVIDLIIFITAPIPWLRKFVAKLDDKRNSLDARLSKLDGENITSVVGPPMEHPKRRSTDQQ